MSETKKGTEIKKWDEVNGVASEELQETIPTSETDAYAKLQINDLARNPLRGIEDLVEQNDNQLDGVINNMPAETMAEKFKEKDLEKDKEKFLEKEKKHSVIEKLKSSESEKFCCAWLTPSGREER